MTNNEVESQGLPFGQLVLMWSVPVLGVLACLEGIAKLLDPSASWPFVPVFVVTVGLALAVSLVLPLVWRHSSTTVSNAPARGVTQR
jgi:hypothetical protein